MEHIKLQLKININSKMILGEKKAIEIYTLGIVFLDKDDSFDADINGLNRIISFSCKNGFRIRTAWDEPFGCISTDGLMIPKLDKVGVELMKTFPTDRHRYLYVKKLHEALEEWANEWIDFRYDSTSTIEIKDNIWTVGCFRRYINRKGKNHHRTNRELMKKNIFI